MVCKKFVDVQWKRLNICCDFWESPTDSVRLLRMGPYSPFPQGNGLATPRRGLNRFLWRFGTHVMVTAYVFALFYIVVF